MGIESVFTGILRTAGQISGRGLANFGDEFAQFTATHGDEFVAAMRRPGGVDRFLSEADNVAGYSDDFIRALTASADDLTTSTNALSDMVTGFRASGSTDFNAYLTTHVETLRRSGVYLDEALVDAARMPQVQARILSTADDAAAGPAAARVIPEEAVPSAATGPRLTTGVGEALRPLATRADVQAHMNQAAKEAFQGVRRTFPFTNTPIPFLRGQLDVNRFSGALASDAGANLAPGLRLTQAELATMAENAVTAANKASLGRTLLTSKTVVIPTALGGTVVAGDHLAFTPIFNTGAEFVPGVGPRKSLLTQGVDAVTPDIFQADTEAPTDPSLVTRTGPDGTPAPDEGMSNLFTDIVKMVDHFGGDFINEKTATLIVGGVFATIGIGVAGALPLPGMVGLTAKLAVLGGVVALISNTEAGAEIGATLGGALNGIKDAITGMTPAPA